MFSLQILFALHEKGLKFTSHEVNITNGEQYSQWFLEMNPKAEVPVLRNGTLIVPESGRIISYLEENFKGGKNFCGNIKDPGYKPKNINGTSSKNLLYTQNVHSSRCVKRFWFHTF